MNLQKLKSDGNLKFLKWWDIAVLTVIMLGNALVQSTMSYFSIEDRVIGNNVEFSARDNIFAIVLEIVLLLVAFLYLRLRNFDFSQWKMKLSFKAIVCGIGMFLLIAVLFDLFFMTSNFILYKNETAGADEELGINMIESFCKNFTVSVIPFAFLNGFYEEIFFLGMCLSVEKKWIPEALIYSIIVRYAVHTYQGQISAICIGLVLGLTFFILYRRSKTKNLIPFFIAHAIGDVFGVGIMAYIASLIS